jgi:hypothetical protein
MTYTEIYHCCSYIVTNLQTAMCISESFPGLYQNLRWMGAKRKISVIVMMRIKTIVTTKASRNFTVPQICAKFTWSEICDVITVTTTTCRSEMLRPFFTPLFRDRRRQTFYCWCKRTRNEIFRWRNFSQGRLTG